MFSCKIWSYKLIGRPSVTMLFSLLGCGNASAVVPQQLDLLNSINQVPNDGGQLQAVDGTEQQPTDGTAIVGSPLGLSPSSWTIGPPVAAPVAPPQSPPAVGPAQRAGVGGPHPPLVVPRALSPSSWRISPPEAPPQSPPAVGPAQRAGVGGPPPWVVPPQSPPAVSPDGVGGPQPPLVIPQFAQVVPGISPLDRNTVNQLLRVLFGLIETNGVPQSLQPGGGGGPPPHPAQIQGAGVFFSQRKPMIMQALLRSLWPGGTSYKHAPDAWIFSRLWRIIREYDTNGTILTYHLNHQHELPGGLQNASHINSSHACDCWTERLGQGWDNRTAAGEIAMLPQGMQREAPDKLKRLLTAVLDEYVKNHDSFPRRNPWISRQQPYYWALWTKPFVRAFLQLNGLHTMMHGQYWYLLDGDATILGQLTGYETKQIHLALIKWRKFELHPVQAPGQPQPPDGDGVGLPPAPAAGPPAAAPAPPPGRVPMAVLRPDQRARIGLPDDYYLIDQLMIPYYMRDANCRPGSIPPAERDAMWAQTSQFIQNAAPKQRLGLLNAWYVRSGTLKKRGNALLRVGAAAYNKRADQHGAPHLNQTWIGQAVVNEQWLQEAIQAALVESENVRSRVSGGLQVTPGPILIPYGQPQRAAEQANVQPPQAPANVQPASPGIQQNIAEDNIVTPQETAVVPLGPPLTLEEIYLIATAIDETQNADQLQSTAIHLIIEQLRVPVVSNRISQMIQLFPFHPLNTSQQDMNLDLWRFELGPQDDGGTNQNSPPPPPSPGSHPGSPSRNPSPQRNYQSPPPPNSPPFPPWIQSPYSPPSHRTDGYSYILQDSPETGGTIGCGHGNMSE